MANNQIQTMTAVKGMLAQDNVKKRFNDVLGAKSEQYMASIVNAVSASPQLKKCEPSSILAAAFVAASLDLPIDQNLGFAALVPYDRKFKDENGSWQQQSCAQFQMMYKGFIQLAIRSGEYEGMNVSEVYSDEILSFNPITGEVEFVNDFTQTTMRDEGKDENIAGFYAWFKLKSGYRQQLYMSRKEVENHARKYSASYKYDLSKNKQSSRWSTDFKSMAKKTVIKALLSKWGILSVQMQTATIEDQKVYDSDGNGDYADNKPEEIEAVDPFEAVQEQNPHETVESANEKDTEKKTKEKKKDSDAKVTNDDIDSELPWR